MRAWWQELGVDIEFMFARLETSDMDKARVPAPPAACTGPAMCMQNVIFNRLNVPAAARHDYFSNAPPTAAVIAALKARSSCRKLSLLLLLSPICRGRRSSPCSISSE